MMMTAAQIQAVKRNLLAAQVSYKRSELNEKSLYVELHNFFQHLKKTVLHELREYWKDDDSILLEGQLDLILAPIFESQQEYYNILRKHNIKEYNSGCREARRLVKLTRKNVSSHKSENNTIKTNNLLKLAVDKDELFGTNDWTQQRLLDQSFTASEGTMNRVDKDINKIISDGYQSGAGINKVAANIETRFEQLKTWEAKRIARTEIHNAHQMGIMNTYYDMGVQYTQWSSAHDSRVRGLKPKDKANHVKMDGEIIPLGGTYSNGLQYPGDTKGPIYEWINCRCGNVPFIIPDGYIAPPGMAQFREKDLIQTLDYWNQDELIKQSGIGNIIPKDNGLSLKLTPSSGVNNIRKIGRNIKELTVNTPEKTAEYFGLDYKYLDLKYHHFVDETYGCVISIEKSMTQGTNPLISMTNNGKAKINLIELLRTYSEAPPNMKKATDLIKILNKANGVTPGEWYMNNGISTIKIYAKTALSEFAQEQSPVQRTMLHELGHAVNLNDKIGLKLGNDEKIKKLIEKQGYSSYYATTKKSKNSKINEEIADAISMVAYKNKLDKSSAIIKVPVYDNNKKIENYEYLNYDEWHDRFNDLATYLENTLGL